MTDLLDNSIDEIAPNPHSYTTIIKWWLGRAFAFNLILFLLSAFHLYINYENQAASPLLYIIIMNIIYFVMGLGGDLFYRNYSQKKGLTLSDKLLLH